MSEQKNFENSLDDLFDKTFDSKQAEEPIPSSMARKLMERKKRNIGTQYVSWLSTWDDAEKKINPNSANEDLFFDHTLLKRGKHFTIPVDKDIVTVMYEIYVSWSYSTKSKYYFVEKAESEETVASNGRKYVTYYIEPQKAGNQIVFLHFNKAENHVLINSGVLINDEVRVGKEPDIFEFQPTEGTKPRCPDAFVFENMTEEEKGAFLSGVSKNSYYSIDVDSSIVTIDVETFQPVPKEVYIEDGEYKAKIKLKSGHNYFSFQIRGEDSVMSDFEIAECYYYGYGDFPKDEIKAAEMFEEIGDAGSLYSLAHIWFDKCNNDVDSLTEGIFCLDRASQMGCIEAKAELVYFTMKLLCNLPIDEQSKLIDGYHERIKSAVATKHPGALFLAAYVYEKGVFVERNTDLSFSYYFCAAQAGNPAAKARIGMAPVGDCQNEDECQTYFNNTIGTLGLPEYVMGWFLADDADVMVATDDILYFYYLAADSGVVPAIREIAEAYMYGNDYIEPDPEKAIMWNEKLTDLDDDTAVKLANYYLDGKGCAAGPESDAKALALLSKTVQKYENGTAYNNLGWMYKTGRGCDTPDYKQALALFEKAASLECGVAYYHMGDIYENGLGVARNVKTALKFYQQGAELENKKCIEKLDSFRPVKASDDQVVSLLADISEQLADTNEVVHQMDGKLDILLKIENAITQLKNQYAIEKLQQEDREAKIEELVRTATEKIIASLKKNEPSLNEEEEHMQKAFGEYWSQLDEYTRDSLISARILFTNSNRPEYKGLDYSGIVISATSALENELSLRFFQGYQKYLEEIDISQWPRSMVNERNGKRKKKAENEFTLGSMPYIFGKGENAELSKDEQSKLNLYLKTILNPNQLYDECPIKVITTGGSGKGSIISRCESVRKEYRNQAAHTEQVGIRMAEDCCNEICDAILAAEKLDTIQGLLLDVVKLTCNYKKQPKQFAS